MSCLSICRHSKKARLVQQILLHQTATDPALHLHSLRGYPRRSLHGTRALLANVELRLPVLRGFLLAPEGVGLLNFPGVQGAIFCDAGQAWYDDWPMHWRGSYGLGLRMGLGGMLVLRFDWARRTDFNHWPKREHREFFIGWNY